MSLFGSFWKKDSGDTRKASSPQRWQVGDKIENRFEINQILGGEGKSGMGEVYVCYDNEHQCQYALKTFQNNSLFSEGTWQFFEREALVWIHLEKHPYIVQAYWVEKLEGKLFIILEYISPDNHGRNILTHYLANLSFPDILKFSIQFCYGMEYVYSKGVDAHRDIKPDNIMITPHKIVKITDFGLTKAFQQLPLEEGIISSGQISGLSVFQTKGGKRVCGTLQYMAPEQFDGYGDKRSDVYSFGITLYQMVTGGKLPFIGRTTQEYERLHKYEKIPTFSSPLFSLIQRCLEKEPNKRYQEFTNIREQLQDSLLKETGKNISLPQNEELGAWELNDKGVSLKNLGKFQEAITCYDKALEIDPRDAFAWNNKGSSLDKLNKHKEAMSCYDKALEIDPRDAMAWNNKGALLYNLGRTQEAISCYDKALEIDPIDADAWYNKGVALDELSIYEEAIHCYDKALKINSRYANAWNNKGYILECEGRYKEAIVCYDKALEIDPNHNKAQENKDICLQKLKQ